MGWAIKNQEGNAVAVGFDRDRLQLADGQSLVEIGDDIATRVLNGEMTLLSVFAPPAPVVAAPPVAEIRRPRSKAYTSRYPAMLTDADVDVLAHLAASLPEKSTAVEIGSRLGGSAKVILEHARSIKRMYCIDSEWMMPDSPAMADKGIASIIDKWNVDKSKTCYAFVQEYLKPHTAVRLLPKSSPYDLSWWSEPIDFVFEDSSHVDPQITDNIWFWWKHLRSGGMLAGHDYGSSTYPNVTSAVNAFTEFVGVPLNVGSNIWWVFKP